MEYVIDQALSPTTLTMKNYLLIGSDQQLLQRLVDVSPSTVNWNRVDTFAEASHLVSSEMFAGVLVFWDPPAVLQPVEKLPWSVILPFYEPGLAKQAVAAGAWHVLSVDRVDAFLLPHILQQMEHQQNQLERLRTYEDRLIGSEVALSHSQRENGRLGAILSGLSLGVLITDERFPGHPVIYANDGFSKLTGYAIEEIIGKNLKLLQGPETDPQTVREIHQAIQAQRPYNGTLLNYRKDGTPFWNEMNIEPVFNEHGELVNYVGVQHDVSDRVRAEHNLQNYTYRIEILRQIDRAILSAHSLENIAQVMLDYLQVLLPYTEAELLLLTPDQSVLFPFVRHLPPGPPVIQHEPDTIAMSLMQTPANEWFDRVYQVDDLAHLEGRSGLNEQVYQQGVRSFVSVPLANQQSPVGCLNVYSTEPFAFTEEHVDILREASVLLAIAIFQTRLNDQIQKYAAHLEVRVAESTAELRELQERATAIFQHTSDAIILASADGYITSTNPAFNSLFGYTTEQAVGCSLNDLIRPLERGALHEAVAAAMHGAQRQRFESMLLRADDSGFSADVVCLPLIDPESNQVQIVLSVRDISERKRMEEDLREALQRERELHELKIRFVTMVSHEFRTPLTMIRTASDLLKRYSQHLSDDKKMEHLLTIQRQVHILNDFMDDILTVGRAEAIGLPFHPTSFDINVFCRDLMSELREHIKDSHRISYTFTGEERTVVMDKKLLRQMIWNLMSNSIKYSAIGTAVTLEVVCDPDQLLMTIKDRGIGIPEEDQKHLFEIFHRSRNVGTTQGTGLGLAIVRHAVDSHRGDIQFQSKPGQGTVFIITLPTTLKTRVV